MDNAEEGGEFKNFEALWHFRDYFTSCGYFDMADSIHSIYGTTHLLHLLLLHSLQGNIFQTLTILSQSLGYVKYTSSSAS